MVHVMLSEYKAIYEGGQGEIVEKKSRFIAPVKEIESEEDALLFIEDTKKKYWDARHNCFAYVLGERHETARFSDDGEPGGTAGKPMLDVLLGEDIHNVAVVVTRYFGGTLLGTGGLVRAYSGAVKAGLAESTIITKISGAKLHIETDYTDPVYPRRTEDRDPRFRLHRQSRTHCNGSNRKTRQDPKRTHRRYKRKGSTHRRRHLLLRGNRRRNSRV